jgi:transposase
VKALACDRPTDDHRRPLSRFSVFDVCERAWDLGLTLSYSTVWRRLHEDALRPWLFQQWLFPRDPLLLEKATPVLELYHRRWEGQPLGPRDVVLSADEMSGLQALSRIHPALPTAPPGGAPLPGRPGRSVDRRTRVEFEYERHGTVCYQAFLNVFTGKVYGAVHDRNDIETFERTLGHCLAQPHYAAAERVFLIVDNGSSHHPSTSPARIQAQYPQVTTVHLPTHSSWLNQIELYFSILHRKALTPCDFPSVAALRERLYGFQHVYNQRAEPFRWQYTRTHLEAYMERLALHEERFAEAAVLRQRRQHEQPVAHCLTH